MNDTQCTDNPHCELHGFDRNASHTEDRYVCDCEGWTPVDELSKVVTQVIFMLERAQDAVKWDEQSYEQRCRWLQAENARLRGLEQRIAKAIAMLERKEQDYSWYYRDPVIIAVLEGKEIEYDDI